MPAKTRTRTVDFNIEDLSESGIKKLLYVEGVKSVKETNYDVFPVFTMECEVEE